MRVIGLVVRAEASGKCLRGPGESLYNGCQWEIQKEGVTPAAHTATAGGLKLELR